MHRSNSSESFVVSNFESESDDASVVTDSQPTPLSASNESSSKLSTEQTLVADLQQTIDLVNSYFRNDVGTQYAVEIVNKTPRQTTSRSFTFETNTHKLVVRVEDTGTSSATEHASSTSSTSSSLARRLRRRLRRPKRVLDSDSSLSSDSRPGSKPVPSGTTRKRPKTKTNRPLAAVDDEPDLPTTPELPHNRRDEAHSHILRCEECEENFQLSNTLACSSGHVMAPATAYQQVRTYMRLCGLCFSSYRWARTDGKPKAYVCIAQFACASPNNQCRYKKDQEIPASCELMYTFEWYNDALSRLHKRISALLLT